VVVVAIALGDLFLLMLRLAEDWSVRGPVDGRSWL
jgi:hypothetical protein